MRLYDTHFHLDLQKNVKAAIKEICANKIYTIGMTNLPVLYEKEQKEYEVIDEEIAALEQKIAKLDSEIEMAATQYSRLTELTQEKSELEEQLEFKMNRWVELNELAELIEQQKQK